MKALSRCVAAAAIFLAAACGGGREARGGISRETFVAANVALRTLPAGAPAERRRQVLKTHRVTDKQLKAWVTAHGRDPKALGAAWDEIAARLDSIANVRPGGGPDADTMKLDSAGRVARRMSKWRDSLAASRRSGIVRARSDAADATDGVRRPGGDAPKPRRQRPAQVEVQ